jgi:hypothetical protein
VGVRDSRIADMLVLLFLAAALVGVAVWRVVHDVRSDPPREIPRSSYDDLPPNPWTFY